MLQRNNAFYYTGLFVDLNDRVGAQHYLSDRDAGVFSIRGWLQNDFRIVFKKTFNHRDLMIIGRNDEFKHVHIRPGLFVQLVE